jgi:hypothetical protein
VEILKFSEPPKRSSRTSTRKKSGVMPLLSVVAAVAIVGGMSSTLAGTISLNTSNTVEFGQGVVTAAACDTTMSVLPTAEYDTNTAGSFKVSSITIKGLGLKATSGDASKGPGCKGKVLRIRAYELNSNTPMIWDGGSATVIKLTLPNTDTMTAQSPDINKSANTSVTLSANSAYENDATTTTGNDTQEFTIGALSISSTVVRFTVESSDS